jgi:hypothetical protein
MTSNITLDASSPNASETTSSNSVTSVSFSPPADSLLVILCSWAGTYSSDPTCTDSVGGTYAHPVHYSPGITGNGEGVDIYTRYLSSAPGSMQVGYDVNGGGTPANAFMAILVLDNCASSQTGAESGTSDSGIGGSSSSEVTVTPSGTGSWLVCISGIGINTSGTTITPVTSFTTIFNTYSGAGTGNNFLAGANETGPSGSTTSGWSFSHTNVINSTGVLEILASAGTPANVDLAVGQINVAGPNPQPTAGHGVPLTTGQVNVAGLTPTITATRITSGGPGAPGNVKLTYISPQLEILTSSLSPVATEDVFGNVVPAGYMGPIVAIQPGSSPVEPESWHSLSLTNATASGNGVNGLFYRYRSDNSVELAWDITLSSSAATIATLPSLYTPTSAQNLPSAWYGTGPAAYLDTFSPALQVTAGGSITVQNCDSLTISLCGSIRIPLDI